MTASIQRKSLFACTPSTTRGQSVALSADPKSQQFLYTNGRSVIIRDFANPALASEYAEHTCACTVAQWSPSGYYIASGDVQGNVRIWDATQDTHLLKTQTRPISSRITDIAWDSESKRLIAVGDGKEKFGHAFTFDTANSCGEVLGHSKIINSCSIRSVRPFRAATASDDMSVNFLQGPPFKFVKSLTDHSRFVQAVRFSPDGQLFVSVGSDAKMFLYDGTTGDKVAELTEGAHTGGIFSVSWSPDSKQLLTSSADMTCKIWDVAARKAVNTIAFSGTVDDQQVGNLWSGSYLLSVALSGNIYYLDPKASQPVKTVYGHQKGITAFTVHPDSKTFYTGSYDGRVYAWSTETGLASPVTGSGHTNQVSELAVSQNGVVSIGMDDTIRRVSGTAFEPVSIPTGSEPRALATRETLSIAATLRELIVVDGDSRKSSLSVSYTPTSVSISPDGQQVAVGADDQKVYVYSLSDHQLTLKQTLDSNRGAITSVAYSPDGTKLAVADTDRKVLVYINTNDKKQWTLEITEWCFHTARVQCLAWSADSQYAVSGGLDRDIYVWSVKEPMEFQVIKGAHPDGVQGVRFLDARTVVSVGADACVKVWALSA